MAKSWPGRAVGEDFLDNGLKLIDVTGRVRVSADEVWADLSAQERQAHLPGVRAEWITPEPLGVGSARSTTLWDRAEFIERYFLWDHDARRWALYIERFGVPGLATLVEAVRVVPDGSGSLVTWQIVVERTWPWKLLAALLKPIVALVGPRAVARSFDKPKG